MYQTIDRPIVDSFLEFLSSFGRRDSRSGKEDDALSRVWCCTTAASSYLRDVIHHRARDVQMRSIILSPG